MRRYTLDPPMLPSHLPRVLILAGVAAWIGVCLTTILMAHAHSTARLVSWSAASAVFILCFAWNARPAGVSYPVLALQSISVIAMVTFLCSGYEGLLHVLVAAQLALHSDHRRGLMWIAVQSLGLTVATALHWTPKPALMLTPPYLGFQVLMFVGLRLFVNERQARQRLSESNDSLLRLQSELALKARVEERLRIAQDMHDILGHHLTALSLNLELASHQSHNAARSTIRTAHSLARVLLSDVKNLVRSADDDVAVDLAKEVRELARELPRPTLHIDCAADLTIHDARASRVLFRIIQEVVTNAIRHGEATNLWITIRQTTTDRLSLVARDDGKTAAAGADTDGFGLSGMRRRLEALGGTLSAAPTTPGGFEVRAELPNPSGAHA